MDVKPNLWVTKSDVQQLKLSKYLSELSEMQPQPSLTKNTQRLLQEKQPTSKLNRNLEKNNDELNLRKSLILQKTNGINFQPQINQKSKQMLHKKQVCSMGSLEQITKKQQIKSISNLLLWGKHNEMKKEKTRKLI